MFSEITNAVGSGANMLMNLVPTPGALVIIPVKQYNPPIPNGPPFIAMLNPEQFGVKHEFVYNDEQEKGTKPAIQKFSHINSQELTFDCIIDGTGATGVVKNVVGELQMLMTTVGFNGKEHAPNKLFIIWGTFIFQGRTKSVNVQYTLFNPNGTPLRAKLTLSFAEDTEGVLRLADLNLFSSDLTHKRIAKSGDRLDRISNAIYDSPRFNLEIARANQMTSIRNLEPGQKLTLPPTEK